MFEEQKLPQEVAQELFVEADGAGFMNQSAIARLVGMTQQNINKLLVNIATTRSLSEPLKQFAGMDFRGTTKIPDYVVGAIIIHFAMYARKKTKKAKDLAVVLAGCSIRTLIQRTLGWQPKNQIAKPLSKAEILVQQSQMLLEHEQRLEAQEVKADEHREAIRVHDQQIQLLLDYVQQDLLRNLEYFKSLTSEELSDQEPEPITLRAKVNKVVRTIAQLKAIPHNQLWTHFYRQLQMRYQFDVFARLKTKKGKSALDLIEENDMLGNLFDIISHEAKKLSISEMYTLQSMLDKRTATTEEINKELQSGRDVYQIDQMMFIESNEAKAGDYYDEEKKVFLRAKT